MQVTLRSITAEDAARIAGLERACFSDAWGEESVRSTLTRKDFCGVILECDGAAVGYVCGTVLFEDAELLRIAILQEKRRLGLGAAVLDAFLEAVRAQKAERVWLEVRESNAAAISLYSSRGFVQGRVRENYYADGEAAVEMTKTF